MNGDYVDPEEIGRRTLRGILHGDKSLTPLKALAPEEIGRLFPKERDAAVAKIQAKQKAALSNALGEHGHALIEHRLRALGFGQIERIETGYRRRAGRYVACRRVAGDIRAVVPGSGRSVLVECKFRDDLLPFHALAKHQEQALRMHHQLGGISILGWTSRKGVLILQFPIQGFGPGVALTWEHAAPLNLKEMPR